MFSKCGKQSAHCHTRRVSERPSTDNLTVKTGDLAVTCDGRKALIMI